MMVMRWGSQTVLQTERMLVQRKVFLSVSM